MKTRIKLLVGFLIVISIGLCMSNFGNSAEFPYTFEAQPLSGHTANYYYDLVEAEGNVDNNYRYRFEKTNLSYSGYPTGLTILYAQNPSNVLKSYIVFQYLIDSKNWFLDAESHTLRAKIGYLSAGLANKLTYCDMFCELRLLTPDTLSYDFKIEEWKYTGSWNMVGSRGKIGTIDFGVNKTLEIMIQHYIGYSVLHPSTVHYHTQFQIIPNSNITNGIKEIFETYALGNEVAGDQFYYVQSSYFLTTVNPYPINVIPSRILGYRIIRHTVLKDYYGFLDMPLFNEFIDMNVDTKEGNEPTREFWYYSATIIEFDTTVNIVIGDWSFDYPLITTSSVNVKHYYYSTVIPYIEYGAWYDVVVNALKLLANIVILIANLFALMLQFFLYLLVLSLNWLIMYLCCGVIGSMLWNEGLKYLVIGVLFLAYEVFYIAVWLWQTILLPALDFLYTTLLPLILQLLWNGFIGLISLIVWMFSGFSADYFNIFTSVNLMMIHILATFIEFIVIFMMYLPYFITWIVIYVQLVAMLWLKYLYVKFRGYTERAKQLRTTAQTFTKPISMVFGWSIRLLRGGSKDSEIE